MQKRTETRAEAVRLDRYWSKPTNIGGLNDDCVERFLAAEFFDLWEPSLSAAEQQEDKVVAIRNSRSHFYGDKRIVVEMRMANLSKFLRQVEIVVRKSGLHPKAEHPVIFHSLLGDSHCGGRRPIMVEMPDSAWVLKFADPRPYQILEDLLRELSHGLGIDLVPPNAIVDPGNCWYFLPYIDCDDGRTEAPTVSMFALGALTAVAYVLGMVDLHLENILVSQGKPIIIDPECIFYNFIGEGKTDRLLSSGLLSHNPALSAIRGGDARSTKVFQVGLLRRADGVLDYRKPAPKFRNRFRYLHGEAVDPLSHRGSLLAGFAAAYGWFLNNNRLAMDIVYGHLSDDLRIRYLVRKTRLYATVIHMLNLPVSCQYRDWRENVYSRFKRAGHFPDVVSDRLFAAEVADLDNRDVPYFWVNAGDTKICHETGPMQAIGCRRTPRDQALHDIRRLSRLDLRNQLQIFQKFLDAELNTPLLGTRAKAD